MYDPLMNDILAKLNSVESAASKRNNIPNQHSGNEMLDILKRFDLAESGNSKLTPVNVKHGLNKQQKAVGQVGPEFKPKTTKVLTAPTDPKNPFAGKLVGGSESRRNTKPMIDEAEVSEDLLSDIKKSLSDYIKQIDSIEKKDTDLKKKDNRDTDLKKKDKRDRDFIIRKVKEDPTQENPIIQPKPSALVNPTVADTGANQTPTVDTDSSKGIQPVGETLNDPYKVALSENSSRFVSFVGHTDTGAEIIVYFAKDEDDEEYNTWEVEFGVNGSFNITNKGDAFRVFATASYALQTFLGMRQGLKADRIYFTAKEPSRIKLYQRLSKMIVDYGFKRVPLSEPWKFLFDLNEDSSNQDRSMTAESIKSHECNGKVFEIVEGEHGGFHIRHNNKFSPSKFKTFLEADTALQLFTHRLSTTGDYREER